MNWTGKKVLVTGAAGFIGSHLCEELVGAGAAVTALIHYSSRSDWGALELLPRDTKSALHVVAGTIEDSHFLTRVTAGHEIVFHLAALIAIPHSYVAPLSYVRTNVEGTLNVMEAARAAGAERVVHTSTSEAYGTAMYSPIDEQHPLHGQSPYSASKIGADKIAESYWRSFDVPVATLRPFNAYGPRQSARAIIPTIISQALTQKAIRLGSLTPVRDLSYVKDTVRAFMKTAESEKAIGRTINAGAGKGITIGELARLVLSVMEIDMPIIHDSARVRPERSEVFHLICDNRLAADLIDWRPSYSLREGLRETIRFVEANLELFKPEQYTR
jgi:NAD dependent epimerase/dehydratase